VSDQLAQRFNRWHSRVTQTLVSNNLTIELKPEHFLRRLEWRRLTKEFVIKLIDSYNISKYEITYESLFANNKSILCDLFKFLNIEDELDDYSDETQSNPQLLRDIIVNYDEIYEYLLINNEYYYKMLINQ